MLTLDGSLPEAVDRSAVSLGSQVTPAGDHSQRRREHPHTEVKHCKRQDDTDPEAYAPNGGQVVFSGR